MYTLATILIVLAAILMILIVLVQNSKGGGLVSGFSSSNQIMGVRKTTDFLEKTTWGLAVVIVLLSIVATGYVEKQSTQAGTEVSKDAGTVQQQEASKTKVPNFNENAKPQAQPQSQPQQPAKPAK
jgi:preprotein translocase subunit SecG